MIVCLPLPLERRCAAIRSPLWNISIVLAVMRASTLLAGKAIGNGVIMPFDLDVVIQPGTPDTPFSEDIALDR